VRRAVAYVLDRPALAEVRKETAADQLVPPAVPGFRAGGFYPLRGPSLAVARRLAGHAKHHAVLYAPCGGFFTPAAEIIRSNLAMIGIDVSVVEADECPGRYDSNMKRADLLLAWLGIPGAAASSNRDPALFFDQALDPNRYGGALGPGLWNDPSFRERVDQARAFDGEARLDAYRRLDAQLMRAAPFAVYGSNLTEEYVSARVGCEIFQGAFGFLDLGALCVR
jgi:ABC-type transport system substrate-binding protein